MGRACITAVNERVCLPVNTATHMMSGSNTRITFLVRITSHSLLIIILSNVNYIINIIIIKIILFYCLNNFIIICFNFIFNLMFLF